uniref:SUEL-type lectin domain-containing protein n=1 Tax=Malurus cyaneus samueli TaxID=2593467 RepID=A0A8C5TYD7_9PASS
RAPRGKGRRGPEQDGDVGQHPRRAQVETGRLLRLLSCMVLVCGAEVAALADFSAEYKTKSACENQELKLHCQESKFLIIYSATYGRWAHEESVCSTKAEHTPPFDCLSYTALEVLSKRCYGKQRCKIIVTSRDFGSPCLPGVTKYLNVSYACGKSKCTIIFKPSFLLEKTHTCPHMDTEPP